MQRQMRPRARCPLPTSRRHRSCLRVQCAVVPEPGQRRSIRWQSTAARPDYLPLSHFMSGSLSTSTHSDPAPYLPPPSLKRTYYIEPYGCQMNFNDSDIVNSILQSHNLRPSSTPAEADIVLLVTCAIRANAEDKVWRRLASLQPLRERGGKVAVLGCMAERLKFRLLEGDRLVDVVCGPDAYRDLPSLLATSSDGGVGNVMLSVDETYADILPVQIEEGRVSGCISIMRGCNNMCAYCIVPFTRGTTLADLVNGRKGKISACREYFARSTTFGRTRHKTNYSVGTKRQFLSRSLRCPRHTSQLPVLTRLQTHLQIPYRRSAFRGPSGRCILRRTKRPIPIHLPSPTILSPPLTQTYLLPSKPRQTNPFASAKRLRLCSTEDASRLHETRVSRSRR